MAFWSVLDGGSVVCWIDFPSGKLVFMLHDFIAYGANVVLEIHSGFLSDIHFARRAALSGDHVPRRLRGFQCFH